MKRLVYLVSLLLLIVSWSSIVAKSEEFRVLAAKGETLVQRDGKGSWNKLNTGNQLFANDNIKISNNAYLGLVHTKGRTMELKKAGTYSAGILAKELSSKKTKVSEQLANYLMKEVANKESDGNYKKNMGTPGAVERGMETDASGQKIKLIANCPRRLSIMGNTVNFSWSKATGKDVVYEFIITDRFDRQEFSTKLKENTFSVDAEALKLSKDVYYFWKVKVSSNEEIRSDEICFSFLSAQRAASIKETVALLKEDIGEENAPAKIILAKFYETNYLPNEADKAYQDAIKLMPDIDEYQGMYKEFLLRTNYYTSK
jgi:hypothetical protein